MLHAAISYQNPFQYRLLCAILKALTKITAHQGTRLQECFWLFSGRAHREFRNVSGLGCVSSELLNSYSNLTGLCSELRLRESEESSRSENRIVFNTGLPTDDDMLTQQKVGLEDKDLMTAVTVMARTASHDLSRGRILT